MLYSTVKKMLTLLSIFTESHMYRLLQEMIIGALKFRNTYACQPYLPEELIPVDDNEVNLSLYFSLLKLYFRLDFNVFAHPFTALF